MNYSKLILCIYFHYVLLRYFNLKYFYARLILFSLYFMINSKKIDKNLLYFICHIVATSLTQTNSNATSTIGRNWSLPSLSELTSIIFNVELTQIGLEASNCSGIQPIFLGILSKWVCCFWQKMCHAGAIQIKLVCHK